MADPWSFLSKLSNPAIAYGLMNMGQALAQAGAPSQYPTSFLGGLGQAGTGFQQGVQQYRDQQMQQDLFDLRQQEAERRKAEDEAKAKSDQAYYDLLNSQPQMASAPVRQVGNYGASVGGAQNVQTASGSTPFGNLTPQQRAFLIAAGPQAGLDILGQQLFAPTKEFKPNVEEFYLDGQKIKGYLDQNGQLVTVGDAVPLYKPEGAGIQVDTNGDGVPDITIGGGGMKPLSGDASQQTLRATLIDQATKDIEGINFENINAGKTAIGSWMSQNPLGEAVAGSVVLNDDEKKLIGAQGKIQEAVISAITGAAYTEEQKQNMRAAMVPLPTDSPSRRMEKLKSAAQFLRQLDKNSGYNRIVEPQGGSAPAGGGSDYKSKYGLE